MEWILQCQPGFSLHHNCNRDKVKRRGEALLKVVSYEIYRFLFWHVQGRLMVFNVFFCTFLFIFIFIFLDAVTAKSKLNNVKPQFCVDEY
jgi:hypothetical protein